MENSSRVRFLESKENKRTFKARMYEALGRIMLTASAQKRQEATKARQRKQMLESK